MSKVTGILAGIVAVGAIGGGAYYYTNVMQKGSVSVPSTPTPTVKPKIVLEEKVVESTNKGPIVLKFSHVVGEDTPKGKAAIYFEKKLEAITNGAIDVQVYPNSKLSSDSQVLKALKFNNVQMAAPSFSKFSKKTPQLAIFDLPFLFKDLNHVHKVQDTEVGEKLKKLASKNGVIALSYWDNHFKQLSSSKNDLRTPAKAVGQKFRIMSSKVLEEQFKAVNAIPKKLSFKEVRIALEKGVIDGQENTISNIYSKEFYKHQKFLTLSNHGYLGYLVVVSDKFWKSLTPELREQVEVALQDATEKEREFAEELNDSQLDKIKEYANTTGKIKIVNLSEQDKIEWIKKVRNVYPKFYGEETIGKELIKEAMMAK